VAGDPTKIEGGTAVSANVPVAQATRDEAVLPERVQEALGQLVGAAKEGLLSLSVAVGLGVLSSMMEEEVDDVVGPRWNRERTAVRHGHEDAEVTLGGRRVEVRRPRMRTAEGEHEVPLQTYEQCADRDPMSRVVLERMLAGVSTRPYRRTQEPVGERGNVTPQQRTPTRNSRTSASGTSSWSHVTRSREPSPRRKPRRFPPTQHQGGLAPAP
jgi:putative transposase